MRSIIEYFALRPAVANVLMFGLIFSSIITWNQIGKEEMPEFEMNWVRINIRYPGASAQDVELFITKPVEGSLRVLVGSKRFPAPRLMEAVHFVWSSFRPSRI